MRCYCRVDLKKRCGGIRSKSMAARKPQPGEDILQAMKRVLKSCCCSRVAVVVVDDVDVGEERSWCNVNTILHSGSAANHGL